MLSVTLSLFGLLGATDAVYTALFKKYYINALHRPSKLPIAKDATTSKTRNILYYYVATEKGHTVCNKPTDTPSLQCKRPDFGPGSALIVLLCSGAIG